MCISTVNFDSIFFLGVTPLFELRNLAKMKDTTQHSLLEQLHSITWNFVVMKDIMCWFAYPQEILIPFFSQSYGLFELRNLAKMKDTTQHSLLAQLLWNRSTEFHETWYVDRTSYCVMHIGRKILIPYFCGSYAPWNLENIRKSTNNLSFLCHFNCKRRRSRHH